MILNAACDHQTSGSSAFTCLALDLAYRPETLPNTVQRAVDVTV